jgi:hypothetical protein
MKDISSEVQKSLNLKGDAKIHAWEDSITIHHELNMKWINNYLVFPGIVKVATIKTLLC